MIIDNYYNTKDNIMKTIYTIAAFAAALMLAAGCAYEYPMPEILPDPELSVTGLQRYPTISIYDEQDITLTVNRTFGVSKAMSIPLVLDEAILDEYNTVYSTDIKLMDSQFYTLPESVEFGEHSKTAKAVVKVKVKDLIAAVGTDGAANCAIPIRFGESDTKFEDAGTMGKMMAMLKIDNPKVNVDVEDYNLYFVSISKAKQTISLSAQANFSTLKADKVTFSADASKVEEYNAAHGTSYSLLDSKYYSVKPAVFDEQAGLLSTDIEFDCASIGGTDTYILPLTFSQNEGYEVAQGAPIYVVVQMTDFKVWVVEGGNVLNSLSGSGEVEVRINAPIEQDLSVKLFYDPESIEMYNAMTGIEHATMAVQTVSAPEVVIPAGSQSCKVAYKLDLSDMPWDEGVARMSCLEVDPATMPEGTIIDGKPVYFSAERSRRGEFAVIELEEGAFKDGPFQDESSYAYNNGYRFMVGKIWLTSENPPANRFCSYAQGQKYTVQYSDKWSDGWLFFDVSDEQMPDKPGCYPLINLQDRTGMAETHNNSDDVTYNCSYFNENSGAFYFDFVIDNHSTAYEMGFVFTRQ